MQSPRLGEAGENGGLFFTPASSKLVLMPALAEDVSLSRETEISFTTDSVPSDAVPAYHPFSVEDYYRLAESGILAPDARVELLDGQIIDMLPIGPFHGNIVRQMNNLFVQLSRGRWLVDMQNSLHLNSHSEPQPDLALLRPLDKEYNERHPGPEDVFLLIEVAKSSIRYDRGRKLAAYARAGIREYWIVNLVDQRVEIYREPLPGGVYDSVEHRQGDITVAPAAFPDTAIRVADLLGR